MSALTEITLLNIETLKSLIEKNKQANLSTSDLEEKLKVLVEQLQQSNKALNESTILKD